MTRHLRAILSIPFACLGLWTAEAGAASTCSFDGLTGAMVVTVNGGTAKLRAVKATGSIQLDAVSCGGATVSNTETIQVVGGALADTVTLTGSFEPGLTAEADGTSEIEISFDLGGGDDSVTVTLTPGPNRIALTSAGLEVGKDHDEDITTAGTEFLIVDGAGGDDIINATAYLGTPVGGRLDLYGGDGNDTLTGDAPNNRLYGEAGDDTLRGGAGNDRIYGGPGNDTLVGGAGNDYFYADATVDGSDYINGGADTDVADYHARSVGLTVTLGNNLPDDGEPGEADFIHGSVEDAVGGDGDDVLVGSSKANDLRGRAGDDEVYGGDGDDFLVGDEGNDLVEGDAGDDHVIGGPDQDVLIGDVGADYFEGNAGDDTMYNADGEIDDVICGDGIDDAESESIDLFHGDCEL